MWLANCIGRRMSLIVASILVFIGVAFQAAASGYIACLYIGRFIAGIAIGIASSVNPLYVSESAPRGIRGLLTGFYQLSIVTGLTVCQKYPGTSTKGTFTNEYVLRLPFGSIMAVSSIFKVLLSTSFLFHSRLFRPLDCSLGCF